MLRKRSSINSQVKLLHLCVAFAAIGWSTILGALYFWAVEAELTHHNKLIELKAQSLARQTQSLRQWIGGLGGIYVQADGDIQPIETLANIKDRDIVTASGHKLTLVNSPKVLRQILAEFESRSNDNIRLIAYDPLSPAGVPDKWELKKLEMLENGAEEVSEKVENEGAEIFRLLYPIKRQKKCTKCHSNWNTEKSIVGGLSIKVDQDPYNDSFAKLKRKLGIGYLSIWLSGLLGVLLFDQMGTRLLQKIEHTSTHDSLTKLLNRGAIERRLKDEINRAARYRHPLAVLLLDIDHFKIVNDTYGHSAGDRVLVQFSETLRNSIRETDIVGRWGGEEFMILATNSPTESARAVATRLLENLRQQSIIIDNKQQISITASIGIACPTLDSCDAEHIVKLADDALYRAKNEGRDRVVMG